MIDCAYRGLRDMSVVGSSTFWWCGALFIIWERTTPSERDDMWFGGYSATNMWLRPRLSYAAGANTVWRA